MLLPLIRREAIADGTTEIALGFAPQAFRFRAGQYVQLCIPNPSRNDVKGNCREFSIASSPGNTAELVFVFRNSESAFKRSLLELPLGGMVQVEGPFGLFTLPRIAEAPVVLIAGGIGITPFMSMVRYVGEGNLPHTLTLLSANHSVERAVYRTALRELEATHSRFHFREVFGRMTPEFIRDSAPDFLRSVFYLAGPPSMVADIRQALTALAVPEDNILAEEFVGYP